MGIDDKNYQLTEKAFWDKRPNQRRNAHLKKINQL